MGCTIENEDLDRGPGPIKNTGFAFKNLRVHGISKQNPQQPDFLSILKSAATKTAKSFRREHDQITILEDFDGLVEEGQSLLVLGRPGSGCSTLLKAIGGSTRGLKIDQESVLNYQGMYGFKLTTLTIANSSGRNSRIKDARRTSRQLHLHGGI
jgi:ATPase subunit of ABC transporter with duplicated ATPase domains